MIVRSPNTAMPANVATARMLGTTAPTRLCASPGKYSTGIARPNTASTACYCTYPAQLVRLHITSTTTATMPAQMNAGTTNETPQPR